MQRYLAGEADDIRQRRRDERATLPIGAVVS
jgi:hypothetical protein